MRRHLKQNAIPNPCPSPGRSQVLYIGHQILISDIGYRYLDVEYRYPDVGYHIRCLMVASGLAEWFKKRLAVGGEGAQVKGTGVVFRILHVCIIL